MPTLHVCVSSLGSNGWRTAAKPHQRYDNTDTYDDADLSDIELGNGYSIPIVSVFVYLGSAVSRDCTDEEDVKMRIDAAGGAFAALRDKIFASKCITESRQREDIEGKQTRTL